MAVFPGAGTAVRPGAEGATKYQLCKFKQKKLHSLPERYKGSSLRILLYRLGSEWTFPAC